MNNSRFIKLKHSKLFILLGMVVINWGGLNEQKKEQREYSEDCRN